MLSIITLIASAALTAGVVGRVNSFEDGTPLPDGQEWIIEWWAFPAISLAVMVATWVLGHLFVTLMAAVGTGHGIGMLIAIPYGFVALESNATPLGAILALPIAALTWAGNNQRYNMAHDAYYGRGY